MTLLDELTLNAFDTCNDKKHFSLHSLHKIKFSVVEGIVNVVSQFCFSFSYTSIPFVDVNIKLYFPFGK